MQPWLSIDLFRAQRVMAIQPPGRVPRNSSCSPNDGSAGVSGDREATATSTLPLRGGRPSSVPGTRIRPISRRWASSRGSSSRSVRSIHFLRRQPRGNGAGPQPASIMRGPGRNSIIRVAPSATPTLAARKTKEPRMEPAMACRSRRPAWRGHVAARHCPGSGEIGRPHSAARLSPPPERRRASGRRRAGPWRRRPLAADGDRAWS